MIYDRLFAAAATLPIFATKRLNNLSDGAHAAIAGGIGAAGGAIIARAIAKKRLAKQGIYPGDPEYKSKLAKAMLAGAAGGGVLGAGATMGIKTYRNISRYNNLSDKEKEQLAKSVGKKELSFVDRYRVGAAYRDVDKLDKVDPSKYKNTASGLARQAHIDNKYVIISAPNHNSLPGKKPYQVFDHDAVGEGAQHALLS